MTLGQLEAETLRLMFANTNELIEDDRMNEISSDPTYEIYVSGMIGALNRCFSDLVCKHVLPIRSKILNPADGEWSGGVIRFVLPDLIPDLADVEKVVADGLYDGYVPDSDVRREGDVLVASKRLFEYDNTVRVLYHPTLTAIPQNESFDTVLPVPDRIAVWIPYYLKSELYRSDEPNEAGEARNWYESAMADILASMNARNLQTRVESVYSLGEI